MFVNFIMVMKHNTFQQWIKKIKIPLIVITGIILIHFTLKIYYKMLNQNCYQNCSDYHLLGEATHWNYNDFVVDYGDTIWVDGECYNEWCICIDECNPGLCCEFLK